MDRTKAKRLARKRSWTGKEVGEAYIYTLSEEIRAKKKKQLFDPPFTREILDKMEQSIIIQEQYVVFRAYASLYSSLVDSSNMAEGQIQQMYNGFYRYLYTLKGCMQADDALRAVQNYPLILTNAQYERLKSKLTSQRRSIKTSLGSTVIKYIEYAINNLDNVGVEVREAIEDTKKQVCTNSRVLKIYNKDINKGYYTLSDDTNDRDVKSEELLVAQGLSTNGENTFSEDVFTEPNNTSQLLRNKLYFEGVEGIKKLCREKGIVLKEEGVTAQDILNYLDDEINNTQFFRFNTNVQPIVNQLTGKINSEREWHCPECVQEISKFEVLSNPVLLQLYDGTFIREFIEDYHILYAEVVKELKRLLPEALSQDELDLIGPSFTYESLQLSNLNIFNNFLKVKEIDILDYYCKKTGTTFNGIAIVREDTLKNSQITENDKLIYNQRSPYTVLESLDSINNNPKRQKEISHYQDFLIGPALRYVYAYNALIDTIATVYDIGYIDVFKKDIKAIGSQIEGFNVLLYNFYSNICGTVSEKTRKRELIKQIYKTINTEKFMSDKGRVEKLKNKLESTYGKKEAVSLLKNLHELILEIMGQKEGT